MNHTYRLVWNEAAQRHVPASELTRCRGKRGGRAVHVRYALLLTAAVLAAGGDRAYAGPTGGTVVTGQGTINQTGDTTTVRQQSQNLSLDWQSFNIARSEIVQFVQPSSTAVAVNRVIGSDPSHIYGHLSANGQVFLINPNGVLFGRTAQVNVGSLVASTLNLTDSDILTGHYTFQSANSGSSTAAAPASVINRGTITASDGGSVALLGGQVSNQGIISARFGTVALAAGSAITLDFNGNHLLNVQVNEGTAGALAENRQLIQADGGTVIMTATAFDALLNTVVNNTGVIEARTVENQGGEISLLGGADGGTVSVDGSLDASAPDGGNGGTIETSGAHVHVADSARISTLATSGRTGNWLVDPPDFTIAPGSPDISGAALSNELQTNNIILSSTDGKVAGNGDLFVNDVVTWSAPTTLTLNADRNILINSSITATGSTAGLILNYAKPGNGGNYYLNNGSKVTLSGSNPSLQIQGIAYTVINSLGVDGDTSPTTLQGIANATNGLSGHYALGSDIDATTTANPIYIGFGPIGAASAPFTGQFHGLGHIISGLTIRPIDQAGLFGYAATGSVIRDVGLVGGTLASTNDNVGALAGENFGTISNSFASMTVTGQSNVGGLVGLNGDVGTITNSDTVPGTGAVPASVQGSNAAIGGLVGRNDGTISNSYSTQQVSTTPTAAAQSAVGGLVGDNFGTISQSHHDAGSVSSAGGYVGGLAGENETGGTITGSYASGDVSPGNSMAGGLVGVNAASATITASYYTNGTVNAGSQSYVGGLVGANLGTLSQTYSTGTVRGALFVGGLVGSNFNFVGPSPTVTNSYATGSVFAAKFAGGLIGDNFGIVSYCYAGGTVTGSGINIGGFIGDESGTTTNSYWISSAARFDYSLATALTPAQAQQASSYLGWDSSVWRNYDGHTAPLLKTFLTPLTITADNLGTVYTASNFNVNGGALSNPTYSINGAGTNPNLFGVSSAYVKDRDAGIYAPDVWSNQQGFDITVVNGMLTISKAPLLVSGISAFNKIYDGTTAATLTGTATVTHLGTDWAISGTGTGVFSDKNVGNGKAVMVSGYTLTGTDTYNYTLVTGVTANITPATVTVTAGASSKTYDRTLNVSFPTGLPTVVGLQQGDGIGISEEYADKNVGTGKTVSIVSVGITDGNGGNNYNLVKVSNTNGVITPANLTLTGVTAEDKVYDTTTAAALSGTATVMPIGGDTVTVSGTGAGVFSDKNVGNGKAVTITGYTLTGADAGNYTIIEPTGVTANITPDNLAITGLAAIGKIYDTTTTATLTGTAKVTALGSDVVTLSGAGVGAFGDKNVGNGKAVTITGYTLTGADAGNYTIVEPTGVTANITPDDLAITGLAAIGKVYDTTTTATLSGTAKVTALGSDVVTLSGTGVGAFGDKNVGNGKAVSVSGYTLTGTDAGNYNLVGSAGLTANITPANLTFTGVTATNKVYDAGTSATLSGTVTVAPLGFDDVSVSGTGTGVFSDRNVGDGKTVTVSGYTLTGTDASNYTLAQPTGITANITPANLTITAGANTKIYDGTTSIAFPQGSSIQGLQGSDGYSFVEAYADKNAGTGKTIEITNVTVNDGIGGHNYNVTTIDNHNGTITPASRTITGITASDKIYDALTGATLGGTATVTPIGSDNVTVSGTGAGAFADKNVGNGKAVSVTGYTLSGTDAGNYTVLQPTGLTANITPATLAIAGLAASSKVYDTTTAATLSGTAAVTGLGSDGVALSGTGVGSFAGKNVGNGKAVTVSGYTLTGADANNYTLGQPIGLTANITPASLIITGLAGSNKVYDATTAATLSGTAAVSALGSDVVMVSGTGVGAFADKNVGNGKAVTVSGYTLTGADANNYTPVEANGLTANITPASLSIAGLTANSKVYDATTGSVLSGAAAVTVFGSDSVSLSGKGVGAFADKNVGNGKAVTVSGYTLNGTDASNYTLVEPTSLTANITPANITISGLAANDKVYDGITTATFSGTATVAALGSDTVSLSGTGLGSFADKKAGNGKAITVSGYSLTGGDASNYTLVQPTGLKANITPKTLTVSGITADDKPYDGTAASTLNMTGATLAGEVGGDRLGLSATGTFKNWNAGINRAVALSNVTLTGADSGNYVLAANGSESSTTANITPARLTITANDQAKVAGMANPALTATYSGFVAGESASSLTTAPTVWTTATTSSPAGNYAINVSGADDFNYNISYVAGTLNVTGNPLGVTGNPGYVGAVGSAGSAGSASAGSSAGSTGQIDTGRFVVGPTASQKESDADESEIYDGMLDIDTPKKVTEALPILQLIVLDKGIHLPTGVQ